MNLPVTLKQARTLFRDFVEHRLPGFGRHQDAMWRERPFLYHSRIPFAVNLHLLNPQECVQTAVEAYKAGRAPVNSVESFVRKIVGWREFGITSQSLIR